MYCKLKIVDYISTWLQIQPAVSIAGLIVPPLLIVPYTIPFGDQIAYKQCEFGVSTD